MEKDKPTVALNYVGQNSEIHNHLVELLMDAWTSLDPNIIEPLLAEDLHYYSWWVMSEIHSKSEYLRAAIFQMEMFGCSEQERKKIRGKLSYLKMIRGDDELYTRLFYRYCDAQCRPPFLELHKLPDYYSRPFLRVSSIIAMFDEAEYEIYENDNTDNTF